MNTSLDAPGGGLRRTTFQDMPLWQEALWREHAKFSLTALEESFQARMDAVGDRTLHMIDLLADPVTSQRTHLEVAADDDERVSLLFVQDGISVVEQNSRRTVLRAGDACLMNMAATYSMSHPQRFRQLLLTVPTEELRRRGMPADEILSQPMRVDTEGLAAPWLAFTQGLWPLLARQGASPLSGLMPNLVDAFGVFISTSPDLSKAPDAPHHLRARALGIIQSECRRPDFDAEVLASTLHVSRRTLFRAFTDDSTTVAGEILTRRLDLASRALRFHRDRMTIDFIAHTSGFGSTSTFHARFQERFGMTPRQYARTGGRNAPETPR